MTKTFLVQPDGSVSVSKEDLETLVPASRYPEIQTKMEDPNSLPEEILPLIHKEVVTLLKKMEECGSDPFRITEHTQYFMEAKALFVAANNCLKKEVMEKRDRLNFDGPRF